MDTQKLNMGWVIITVSGLITKETSKLVRGINKRGAHKLAPRTFAISCVRGHAGTEKLVNELRALGTKETSFQAIYVTRAQWERSFMVHGLPAPQNAVA